MDNYFRHSVLSSKNEPKFNSVNLIQSDAQILKNGCEWQKS